MNVLLVRPKIDRGGSERIIIWLAQGLTELGNRVVVASSGGDWIPKITEWAKYYQAPLYPSTLINLFKASVRIRRIIQLENIDVVNTHHRFAALVSNLATQSTSVPVVSTVHEMRESFRGFLNLSVGDCTIVFSQAVKNFLILNGIKNPNRIHKVTIGLPDLSCTSNSVQIFPKTIRSPEGAVVACIARLSPEKGCSYFLKAAKRILLKDRNVQFILIGDGPERESLFSLCINLGIQDHVTFLGWVDQIPEIIKDVDFLVLPSLTEALGLTILEGWSLEKPSIASDLGGISELIQDKVNGMVVPAMDEVALSEAISYMLMNPVETKQMGINGKKKLDQIASYKVMLDETEKIFSDAINNH